MIKFYLVINICDIFAVVYEVAKIISKESAHHIESYVTSSVTKMSGCIHRRPARVPFHSNRYKECNGIALSYECDY